MSAVPTRLFSASWNFLLKRPKDKPRIRIFNPDLEQHKKIHEGLKATVKEIRDEYAKSKSKNLSEEVLAFMKTWLTDHIQGRDKAYQSSMEGKEQEIEAANREYLDKLEAELSG